MTEGYQVLYRKYRPRDFAEVVGQDHVVAVLKKQVASGRVAHAYLFSGPRGIGKTSIARIIAKAVNCSESGSGKAPCNACASCEAFSAGHAMNLIEIDAASNRGIDEIRELREAVRFAPVGGGTKVYIIDEVHQLTKEAFNALLKTLEEPPAHAIFVLATTELDKVPQTIVSRTQHFDFRRPRRDVIAARLTSIAGKEKLRLEPAAADIIAYAAEGSLRDAESMLGKVVAASEGAIVEADVRDVLGIPPRSAVDGIASAITARDLGGATKLVSELYEQGYEMEYLTKLLIDRFRETLLAKLEPDAGRSIPRADYAVVAASLTPDALASGIARLIDALTELRRTPIPQLPLELALIDIIHGIPEKS